jgi:hypothetical protein
MPRRVPDAPTVRRSHRVLAVRVGRAAIRCLALMITVADADIRDGNRGGSDSADTDDDLASAVLCVVAAALVPQIPGAIP